MLKIVEEMRTQLDSLQLTEAQASEMNAELATLKAQIGSSKPKEGVLKSTLKSIRSILESATGSGIAAEFLDRIKDFV